jgi:hypothetical protein
MGGKANHQIHNGYQMIANLIYIIYLINFMVANSNISSFSNFGWSTDVNKLASGVLIGAPKTNILENYKRKNRGAAWFYIKYKDYWRKARFTSPGFVTNGEFGKSVAINDSNLLAIGEPYYSNVNFNENPFNYGFGAVHLYKFNNTNFPSPELLTTLTGNGYSLSQFGYSIDLNNNGDLLVVGAPTDFDTVNNITCGKVYVYKNTNDNWELKHTLTGVNNFGYFGKCVKINSGNLIVVAENQSFYIYDYNDNISQANTFNLDYDNFQTTYNYNYNKFIDTDIEGTQILIGNPYHGTGIAELYQKISNIWIKKFSFTGNSGYQFFGASVGLSSIIPIPNLEAPTLPFTSDGTETSFRVNWAPVSGATHYLLDISTSSDFSDFFRIYENLIMGRTNQLIRNLTPEETYHIRVRAANYNEISSYSPVLAQLV